ncbi:hypothetical protein OIU80_04710 [Flavobacterium sp. LS1R47]|uniref:Uncharacterized protein n=1 Tax=Flavobacterium frigoritolerans TaxID=2987686 RepID=A0A9X3C8J1_9FLAO|nr:hypothetical protein [Flavobacterium frigoritolerans]MCV9931573.1 hypothetical protein [Flavobacterium frigoritolerans]
MNHLIWGVQSKSNLNEREKKYLKLLKLLVKNNRVRMPQWEQIDNWEKQKASQIINDHNGSYYVSVWLKIFELDENDGASIKEIGKTLVPNL